LALNRQNFLDDFCEESIKKQGKASPERLEIWAFEKVRKPGLQPWLH
jgi:hypothetical protein